MSKGRRGGGCQTSAYYEVSGGGLTSKASWGRCQGASGVKHRGVSSECRDAAAIGRCLSPQA
ncbi:MAG: hypothetical protein LBK25_03525 [Treponema sp.]|nr:hypothetical protein [Treponema sp.]